MSPTNGSTTWTHAPEVFSRPTISSPSRNGLATEHGRALVSADCVVPSWTRNLSTGKPAAPPKPLGDTTIKNHATQASPRNPEGSQQRNPSWLIFLAALDLSVASPNAAAARGDAAQAAFYRKLSNYRQEIPDLRNQGIHYRPLVWTADGGPRPAVTRTLQYAADVASSRNSQQMSAKSLQRR